MGAEHWNSFFQHPDIYCRHVISHHHFFIASLLFTNCQISYLYTLTEVLYYYSDVIIFL